MKTATNTAYYLQVVFLALIIGIGLQVATAWTSPTSAPPSQSVTAPITTSITTQTKSGSFGVLGILSGNMLRTTASSTEGTACAETGLIATDTGGVVLSCQGGTWRKGTAGSGGSGPISISSSFASGAFSFAKPSGATKAHVQLHGGGAAGFNSTGANYGGNGGGAGGYSEKIIDVSSVASLSGSIGSGGVASGGAGGASILTGYMTVNGGSGMTGGTAIGGDLNFSGRAGIGGQGGYMGGAGGDGYLGGGGATFGPNAGAGPYGIRGGGGAGGGSYTPAAGGAGGAGFVIVYWY